MGDGYERCSCCAHLWNRFGIFGWRGHYNEPFVAAMQPSSDARFGIIGGLMNCNLRNIHVLLLLKHETLIHGHLVFGRFGFLLGPCLAGERSVWHSI